MILPNLPNAAAYGPIKEITLLVTRVGLIEQVTGAILYERKTVRLAEAAADAVLRYFTRAHAAGTLPPGIEWSVYTTTAQEAHA